VYGVGLGMRCWRWCSVVCDAYLAFCLCCVANLSFDTPDEHDEGSAFIYSLLFATCYCKPSGG